jgi:hypothetical protein
MRNTLRFQQSGLRKAAIASVALHLALAIAVVIVSLTLSTTHPDQAEIDTSISDVKIQVESESPLLTPPIENNMERPPPSPQQISIETAHPPNLVSVPNALSTEIVNIIRRSLNLMEQNRLVGPKVDPEVKPIGTLSPAIATPLHGSFKPDQTVVYILDCSGSMGEFGKLALARAALIATLYRQPEGVRFQIILYNSTVRQFLPGGLVPVTANLRAVETRLALLEAAGRSNHSEALRLAVGLRPDVIVWLTDADDLSPAQLKPLLNGASKQLRVYVANVAAGGVGNPVELR